jgi:hypothetical protein
VDDRKYFDQYRAFRPNPLVRLSILAPSIGVWACRRKRRGKAFVAREESSRKCAKFNVSTAEVTEIKYSTSGLRSDFSELDFAAIGEFRFFASKNAILSTKVFDLDVFDGLASTLRAGARR